MFWTSEAVAEELAGHPIRRSLFSLGGFVADAYKMNRSQSLPFVRQAWCLTLVVLSCAGFFGDLSASGKCQQSNVDERYSLAAGYYARGQWDHAESAFAELIDRHPGTEQAAAAAFFYPEAQMQQGRFRDAYQAFQAFLKRHPDHPYASRAMFRMGESAYRTRQYEVAIRMLEEFIKKNPQHELNEFALPYLGQLRNLRSEPQLAQIAFETSLKLHPNGTLANRARLGLAKALQNQTNRPGTLDEAKRFYDFLVQQLDPEIAAEARIQLAVIDFGRVDLEAAEKKLRDAIRQTDDQVLNARATYWLARIEMEQSNFVQAIELLLPIATQPLEEPLQVSIWYDGAIAAIRANQETIALQWLQRIRTTYPSHLRTSEAVRLEIDLLRKTGRFDDAVSLAQRYHLEDKLNEVKVSSLEARAREHYQKGEFEQAIQTYNSILSSFPSTTPTSKETNAISFAQRANWQYLRALAQLGNEDYSLAEQSLVNINRLISSSDENEINDDVSTSSAMDRDAPLLQQLRPLVELALATSRFAQYKYSMAAKNYESFLQLDREGVDSRQAKTELAICLAKVGKLTDSDRILGQLVESAKGSSTPSQPEIEVAIEILAESATVDGDLPLGRKWLKYLQTHSDNSERSERLELRLAFAEAGNQDGSAVSAQSLLQMLEGMAHESSNGPAKAHRNSMCKAAIAKASQLETLAPAESQKLYRNVLRISPEVPMQNIARVRLAMLLQRERKPQQLGQAQALLQDYLATKNVAAKPLVDEVLYQLGWIAHDLGNATESEQRFRTLVKDHRDSKYWADAAYRLLQKDFQQQRFEAAKSLIRNILETTAQEKQVPDQVRVRVRLIEGQIAIKQKDWETAARSMSAAENLDLPAAMKTQVKYWKAESLFQRDQTDQAAAVFDSIRTETTLSDQHRPWVDLRIAQIMGRKQQWEQAGELAAVCLKRYANFANRFEFQFIVARSQESKGLLDDAQANYQKVIAAKAARQTETAAMAQWRIGECLFHQENYPEALNAYYRVDSLYGYPHWRSAALLQAGKCQELLRNPANAIKLYQQLLRKYPDSSFAPETQKRLSQLESKLPTQAGSRSNSRTAKRLSPSGTQ